MVKQRMLTPAEARNHEERTVILWAMSTRQQLEVALWSTPFPLRREDRLLLCSDGLYERLEDRELASLASSGERAEACRELVRIAIERVSSDNVTVAILQLGAGMVRS
jgi:protein phosphatase